MFDTALLESRRQRGPRGGTFSLPAAIGAHVLIVGAFVGATAWSVDEPPEPEDVVIFARFGGGLPPGPSGPEPLRPRARGPRPPSGPATAPTSTHPADAVPAETAPRGDSPGGDPIGDGSGEAPGSGPGAGGTASSGNGTGPGDGTGLGTDEILTPGVNGVRPPESLTRFDPIYPDAARRARIEGIVILEAVITAAGDVDHVRIVASVHPLLDAAAAAAVRQWRYRPATRDGRAVAVYLTVQVRFGLKS